MLLFVSLSLAQTFFQIDHVPTLGWCGQSFNVSWSHLPLSASRDETFAIQVLLDDGTLLGEFASYIIEPDGRLTQRYGVSNVLLPSPFPLAWLGENKLDNAGANGTIYVRVVQSTPPSVSRGTVWAPAGDRHPVVVKCCPPESPQRCGCSECSCTNGGRCTNSDLFCTQRHMCRRACAKYERHQLNQCADKREACTGTTFGEQYAVCKCNLAFFECVSTVECADVDEFVYYSSRWLGCNPVPPSPRTTTNDTSTRRVGSAAHTLLLPGTLCILTLFSLWSVWE